MSKPLGRELPENLFLRLSGTDLPAHAGKVILICTVDIHGWPHPAMLSYVELFAADRHNLRMATYQNSTTANNMRADGKITISIVDTMMAYYIKGSARELNRELMGYPHLSKFNVHVEEVLSDQTDDWLEAGAFVASGITFRDLRPAPERSKEDGKRKALLE